MYIICHVQLDASAIAAAAAARLTLHVQNPTANITRWMQTLQCVIPTTHVLVLILRYVVQMVFSLLIVPLV